MKTEQLKRKYDKLIEKARIRAKTRKEAKSLLGEEIHEHHIIPKCLGGENRRSNYAYLTISEHIEAHKLLSKLYPEHEGLQFAVSLLEIDKQQEIRNKLKKAENEEVIASYEKLINKINNNVEMNSLNNLSLIEKQFSRFMKTINDDEEEVKEKAEEKRKLDARTGLYENLINMMKFTEKDRKRLIRKFRTYPEKKQETLIRENMQRIEKSAGHMANS